MITPRHIQKQNQLGTWPPRQKREELAEFLNDLSDDSTDEQPYKLLRSDKVGPYKKPALDYNGNIRYKSAVEDEGKF